MESVELQEGLLKIGKGAFRNCRSLCCIDIPESVLEIGEDVFEGCHNLCAVSISRKFAHHELVKIFGQKLLRKIMSVQY